MTVVQIGNDQIDLSPLVQEAIVDRVADYNTARPHSSLADHAPTAYAADLAATSHHAGATDTLRVLAGCSLAPKGEP